ncbi:MAG: HEPN domain-containing protein [Methylococcaceae bacterium]
MRVKEEFKKSGYFWLPSTSDNKITGTLSISDSGRIELEYVGQLQMDMNDAINNHQVDKIVGRTEDGQFVTLEKCLFLNKNLSMFGDEISKGLIQANKIFIGIGCEENELPHFNTVLFSVEGIDEWVGISGIEAFIENGTQNATISYNRPEDIAINLDNGMQLSITFAPSLFNQPKTEIKIIQKTYFKLVCTEEKELNEFISVMHKITTLLCLGIDEIVCLDSVEATSNNHYQNFGDIKRNIPIKIYYQSLPYSSTVPKIEFHQMLFTFGWIKNNFAEIINNWLNAYETLYVVFDLYFSTKMEHQKYSDGKFLALVQGLETYHRKTSTQKLMPENEFNELVEKIVSQCPENNKKWLEGRLKHGNEINLRKRIENVLEPFKNLIGNCKTQKKLVGNIVATRNHLTHYEESSTSVVEGIDLYFLCLKMEAIFQLHFLSVLGFSTEEIKSIFDSTKLQRKLQS